MKNKNRMNEKLFRALEIGDVDCIQSLHKQDSQVLLGVTFEKDSPLHIAAREGHLPIVERILQLKPCLAGALNKDWNLPLHEAAKYGNLDLVRILLGHKKSSVYYYNKFGETALIIASKYGHLGTVNLLCEAKKYNNANEKQQCLRVAAYGGHQYIVEAIVGHPFKHRLFLFHYPLVVFLARYLDKTRARLDCVRDFLQDDENGGANPYLLVAVSGGHCQVVEAILNSPAWKDRLMRKEDECGRCPIHVAVMKGYLDIMNEFTSRMPDCVEIRSSDHKSVLHFAVEYNQIKIVENLLLDKSPQKVVELVSRDHDHSHNTALHLGAQKGGNPEV